MNKVMKQISSNTLVPNKVLQNLYDAGALGLWCYLHSKPSERDLNKKQIRKIFNIGRDKLDALLKVLENCNLIEIKRERSKNGCFLTGTIHAKNGLDFIPLNESDSGK